MSQTPVPTNRNFPIGTCSAAICVGAPQCDEVQSLCVRVVLMECIVSFLFQAIVSKSISSGAGLRVAKFFSRRRANSPQRSRCACLRTFTSFHCCRRADTPVSTIDRATMLFMFGTRRRLYTFAEDSGVHSTG